MGNVTKVLVSCNHGVRDKILNSNNKLVQAFASKSVEVLFLFLAVTLAAQSLPTWSHKLKKERSS